MLLAATWEGASVLSPGDGHASEAGELERHRAVNPAHEIQPGDGTLRPDYQSERCVYILSPN